MGKIIYLPQDPNEDPIVLEWDNNECIIVKSIKELAIKASIYSIVFMKKRWLEAEPYIMQYPNIALDYMYMFIDGRWKEAEPYIMQDKSLWEIYKFRVREERERKFLIHSSYIMLAFIILFTIGNLIYEFYKTT